MKLLENPNYVAAGYALDLYCKYASDAHVYAEFPHQYTGELGTRCRKNARRAGWILHKDNTATCPKCARALKGANDQVQPNREAVSAAPNCSLANEEI